MSCLLLGGIGGALAIAPCCNAQAVAGEAKGYVPPPSAVGALLAVVAVVSGWAFGRSVWKRPISIGLAALGAGCGIGLGYVSGEAFPALVPALSTVFGGTLVCALSAKIQSTTARLGDKLSHATATFGIPFLLGLSLNNRLALGGLFGKVGDAPEIGPALWAAIGITLAATVGLGFLLGRLVRDAPLSLAAAGFGAFAGMATGISLAPIVAYVASAVLGLFTWAASYAFVTSPLERRKIGAILLSFGSLLVVSLLLGAISHVGLRWEQALLALVEFCALMLPALALGVAVGIINGERLSGAGVATIGSGLGLLVGLSRTEVVSAVAPGFVAMLVVLTVTVLATDRKNRTICYRLLGSFTVLALLGWSAGHNLSQGDIRQELDELRTEVDSLRDRLRTEEFKPIDRTLAQLEDQVDVSVSIWVEGSASSSALQIDVPFPLGGQLRVVERVDGRVLYAGTPTQSEVLRLSGESLEISWPAAAGADSVVLKGWRRMVQQNGSWTVVGRGEAVDTSSAEIRNGRFILVYPTD